MSKRKFESGASKRKRIDQDLLIKCANHRTQTKLNFFSAKSTGKLNIFCYKVILFIFKLGALSPIVINSLEKGKVYIFISCCSYTHCNLYCYTIYYLVGKKYI